jgi:hypothetical protein
MTPLATVVLPDPAGPANAIRTGLFLFIARTSARRDIPMSREK